MFQLFYRSAVLVGSMLLALSQFVPSAAGAWLDIDPLTFAPGYNGSFTGTLATTAGPISVSGNFDNNIELRMAATGPGGTHGQSTIDNTSPQFSYAGIFTPTIARTDRVGYDKLNFSPPSRITINFAPPVTNPVFHIANLDASELDFSPTITTGGSPVSMTLLSGNGDVADNDGLALSGTTLYDLNKSTVIARAPNQAPQTTGTARSAYGSVLLTGTYSALLIDSTIDTGFGDGGSFTISIIPEPASATLGLLIAAVMLARRNKRSL